MNDRLSTPYVLLADDDDVICKVFERFFGQEGWRYDIVHDGQSALKASASKSYDIVITDWAMPGLDGLDLLRGIRSKCPNQPIIVVSGSERSVNIPDDLRGSGNLDFLAKPVDLTAVKKTVQRILEHADASLLYELECLEDGTQQARYRFRSDELSVIKIPFVLGERLLATGKISLSTKLRLELVLQEAIANALEHGNLELESSWKDQIDADGKDHFSTVRKERLADAKYNNREILLEMLYKDAELVIKVSDEGAGFDHEAQQKVVEAPESDSDLIKFHGRGVPIIKGIMDEVRFEDGGRTIVMTKNLKNDV